MRPGNYPLQAETYDLTRHASPTILAAVLEGLGEGRGRTMVDVAGGTGNYAVELARARFRPVVADAERAMVARAAAKLPAGSAVVADAAALPFRDGSFDCATVISAFHLFDDKLRALGEVRRVMRAGPLVMQVFTYENLRPLFTNEYFPDPFPSEIRETEAQHVELLLAAGFARVDSRRLAYRGVEDGSLSALHTDPALISDEAHLRNTSYWQGMDEDTRRAGLEQLQADLRSGALARRVEAGRALAETWGHVTVLVAHVGLDSGRGGAR